MWQCQVGTRNFILRFYPATDRKSAPAGEVFPLKVEVFEGNINDHTTVQEQIQSIKEEFNTSQVIFVGDRGMKIRYNLEGMDEAGKQGVRYITGLTFQYEKN